MVSAADVVGKGFQKNGVNGLGECELIFGAEV